ncbi:restriction endonuclease subunit S [Leifsonia sp. YAF41]|uniref:restriction endonuclease subunit S n=1 Tax=Leifsonia sp. YAF41 TaxID=3233086 RepID=UPI003F9815A9
MSLKPYPGYKDSGLQWLDSVPIDWSIAKLNQFFQLQHRAVRKVDNTVTAFRDGQVTLRSNRRLDGFTEADKEIGYQGVRPGDLVIHQMDAFAGAIGVSDSEGKSTPVYSVCAPIGEASSYYFAYLLRHLARTGYIEALARGIRERSTDFRWATAKQLELPGPPPAIQQAIVEFLDRETAEIDAFIADQEELIALLNERRAATISHAVTRGLDASAPMKDTGVEWWGEIPAGWRLTPLRFAANFQEGPGIGAVDFRDEGIPLIRVSGVRARFASLNGANHLEPEMVRARWQHFQIREGDLLISASASMGTVSEAGREVAGAVPYTGIIRMNPTRLLTRDFLRLCLQSAMYVNQIDRLKTGSTIQHYGPQHLREMYLPVPPLVEQREISDLVASEVARIDAATADAHEAVKLSRERRAALISAAVTGKIDVRNHGGVE